jgi:hypothetical protein
LKQAAIPNQSDIEYGTSATQSTTFWPSATVQIFQSHVGQVPVIRTNLMNLTATSVTMKATEPRRTNSVAVSSALATFIVGVEYPCIKNKMNLQMKFYSRHESINTRTLWHNNICAY